MKKLFLEIFIFLAVFFSAYLFVFQEGSTTGGRALFSLTWLFLLCCYLLFIKQFKAVEILGLKEILERVETLEKEINFIQEQIKPTQRKSFYKSIGNPDYKVCNFCFYENTESCQTCINYQKTK